MIEAGIFSALLFVMISANLYHRSKLAKRRAIKRQRGISQLSLILELIQKMQRHRGLCANLTQNQTEQRRLSMDIDYLWSSLISEDYAGNLIRVKRQQINWQAISAAPENSFMPHCQLIEKLLHELTVIADTCSLTAQERNHDNQNLWHNVLKRPQFAESLGRLRALGNKAASLGHCPADIRVQLLYQLQNIEKHQIEGGNTRQIITLINNEILTPEQISIEPRVYFNQLTQAIDEQLSITRDHLSQLS
ncbi:hypothetical protein WNY58_02125 [Neptuniibacter pectenicola]|jgi:hypothetical protein|uniref:Nitrate and nitrite sensing n=1 Tax=Neptuniibacter pectenicola TaxID=1806669 RepID=A0ABU9TN83_9GAMM|nr:hypothetical protein [Neptuniibacter pectenicola]|tara:strand:- start:1079 stop:1825 length:747 start_codon:yes stop_codon:yes gene_type:complete